MANFTVSQEDADKILFGTQKEFKVISESVYIVSEGIEAFCILERAEDLKHFLGSYKVIGEEVIARNSFLAIEKL